MHIEIIKDKSYGILLSGGIDSAILLYLLIKANSTINLQPFTIPKHDGAALYANPIIEHFNKKFNLTIPKTILVGNPNVFHRIQSTIAIKEIFKNHSIDYLFNGLNKNPPILNTLPGAPIRTTKSPSTRLVLPFVDLYKDAILQIMYDNQQEDLIDITHTCTEQQYGRCGICWQCTERKWAFAQLTKIDTGQL